MNYLRLALQLLDFNPHAAFAGGSSPHDVPDDIELAPALGGEGEPFGRICKKLGSDFRRRVRVPVVRLFSAANDGTSV